MTAYLHTIVIGSALALMLALLVGIVLAKGYQIASRQLSRGGMIAFLIVCGIATVKAQKTFYVDINKETRSEDYQFRTIQEAFDFLNGKYGNYITVSVAPGTYPPVDLTNFDMDPGPWPVEMVETFYVEAACGAGSVIIDGGGGPCAVKKGEHEPYVPREWRGLVLSNAVCGGVGGSFSKCIATCCQIGFKDANLTQCLAYDNTCVGALNCSLDNCTVVNNHGHSDTDAIYDATGVQGGMSLNGSIVWGNTKDGLVANVSGSFPHSYVPNCTDPLLGGYEGNICADPLFVDPARHDYHLTMGSPCINVTGRQSYWDNDFDGNPRVQRGIVDMGAYEFQPTNDAQTITAPVPVEFAWVAEKCPDVLAAAGGDYDKAVLQMSANPVDISVPEESRSYYSIWQSYLLDLNPTDSNATWYATIKLTNGVPVVASEPESPNRKYTNLGKHSLTDETWSATCADPRFFKVKVELK